MEILHMDRDIIVCIKPPRVLSTDEPGGMPELLREALGDPNANIRTVHRLDRVVSGLMVFARSAKSASELSRQMREGQFHKEYLAVVHGAPAEDNGTWEDLLLRNKAERKTYVVNQPGKDVQIASLSYQVLDKTGDFSKVRIQLHTGRTHQIRCQFSSHGHPLAGDRKYSLNEDECEIALWSYRLAFLHPYTKEPREFIHEPPKDHPWTLF